MRQGENNTRKGGWQTVRHIIKRASPHTVNMEKDEEEDRIEKEPTREKDVQMDGTGGSQRME